MIFIFLSCCEKDHDNNEFSCKISLWMANHDALSRTLYFQLKTEKVNITSEFCIFKLLDNTKFGFRQIILNFGTKFAQKGYFCLKRDKVGTTIKSAYLS